ncbi:7453_t:CDS:2 [Scutellospora calospora]|uniref:7453_t:CDS:1 n=1 Tax=Scutellospora calospora TaxID=85575 RepID=A0ACA9JYJ9_9GLOM|nr:7453_t:CDS:2 [Scutellospora calospora]
MTTLGNTDTSSYKLLYNTNSSILKEKSSISEVSSNTTSRDSSTSRETVSFIEIST